MMSNYVAIPEQKKEKMKTVEVTVDVMFVNNIPFVIYHLEKCEVHHNWKHGGSESGYLLKALHSIKSVYTNKNIFINTIYMDNEF